MSMNPMLKLLLENRKTGFFRAESQGNGETTIYVYDVIVGTDAEASFWGGVSAETFVKTLRSITDPVVHVRINSPGGDIFAARAMEQAMREHASHIVAHIDGYAASAASFLAMSANEINISKGGFFMIHKAWTMGFGNSDDMLSMADLLEKIDETLVETYVDKTGVDAETVRDWMKAETWFTAHEAVENGFADAIASDAPKNNSEWNLSAYARAPKQDQKQDQRSCDLHALRRRFRIVEKAA